MLKQSLRLGIRWAGLLPLLFFFSDACIDPLVVRIASAKPNLVVDGLITDQSGPYQVKLLYSSKPDTISLKRPTWETGASVWIINDDTGESELLTEVDTAKGTYLTNPSGIQGEVGKHYSLRILTAANREYRSPSQEMLPSGSIEKLYAAFNPKSLILKGSDPSDAFSIFVDAVGSEASTNLYRWRWTGTYKGQTFPERKMTFFQRPGPPTGLLPDPEPCSGYIYDRARGELRKIGPCTCCYCWVTENSKSAIISDNRFFNDRVFPSIEIAKIAVTPFHFFERYYLEVEQLSLSPEVYNFWKLARAQQQSNGSLFQPNAIHVQGNITCVNDPEETVMGVFSVSGSAKKSFSILRSEVPVYIPPIDTLPINCMQGLYGDASTNYKPIFW